MFCPQCGKEIPDASRFCVHCGNAVPNSEAPVRAPDLASAPPEGGVRPAAVVRRGRRIPKLVRILGGIAASVIVVIVWDAHSEVNDIEAAGRELTKSTASLQKFRDEGGGIAMGCVNRPYSTSLSMPGLGFGSALADNPKIQALNNYMKSASDLAHATEQVVISQEQYINVKWPKTPSFVEMLPWLRARFSTARTDIDRRIAWAKKELADHSCEKR